MNDANDVDLTIERGPTLAETIAGKIADAIGRGQFPPGTRLVEADLAGRFGVSRGPIREALQLVANDGLVQSSSGRGTVVIQPSTEELGRMILVRSLLEGCAARLFVMKGDPASLDRARDIVARMRASTKTGAADDFRELHWQFHETICRSADNGFLLRAWMSLRSAYQVFGRLKLGSKLAMNEVVKTHELLLTVLGSGDGDEAEAMFRSLIMIGGYRTLGMEIPAGLRAYITYPDHGAS